MFLAGWLGIVLCSMSSPLSSQAVQMRLDLSGGGPFFDLPVPSDLRTDASGQPDMNGFPNPQGNLLVSHMRDIVESDSFGWGIAHPIFIAFDGPLDAVALSKDPRSFVPNDAVIQLLDVDPSSPERGRRHPIHVNFRTQGDSYRPGHLLEVLPVQGLDLREDTTYALIVSKDVPVPAGFQIQVLPALLSILRGQNPGGALGARAVQTYAPLADQLALENRDPGTVVAASVFTTGAPTEFLRSLADQVAQATAPQALTPLQRTRDFPEYYVLESDWSVPMFQNGTPPYWQPMDGGVFQVDAQGVPLIQDRRVCRFVITIPKGVMPAQGFPLLFYVNGTGGRHSQVYDRGEEDAAGNVDVDGGPAEIAAQRGWAASGMTGHLAPEHIGLASLDGFIAYNVFNPRAMRDNFMQMMVEQMLFRKLLNELSIDPALCPQTDASASPDGQIRMDPQMQVAMGQSLGSYLSGMLAAVDQSEFQGAILTGAGGSWIEFARGPSDPIDLQMLLETSLFQLPAGEELDIWHPLFLLVEMVLSPSSNIHYLDELVREPKPQRVAPHVFVIEGYEDLQVPDNLQRALALSLGIDLAGPEVGPFPWGQIYPAMRLAGAQQFFPPVQLNYPVSGQGLRTAVVVRYLQDNIRHGHFVTFQLEAPKHQYGCFLETLAQTGSPIIVHGVLQGAPCQ